MLLSYNDYQTHKQLVESRRQLLINIFNQFEEIRPVLNEAITIVEAGIFDEVFESDVLNEENLVQRMKAKFDQAVQTVKQKGKDALSASQEKIIQLGGKISSVIKLMVQKLREWVSEEFAAAKAAYAKVVNTKMGDIKAALDKKGEDTKALLVKEMKHLKQVASSIGGWLSSGFTKQVAQGAVEVAKEDVKEAFEIALLNSINEAVISGQLNFSDLLTEGGDGHGDHGPSIPFITTIAHKLHHVPPFNMLDKVKQGAEKVAAKGLDKLSYYATELAGAPGPYKFVATATLVGILAEVKFKGIATGAIVSLVPGLKTITSIIGSVAMAMAILGVYETLMKKDEETKK